MAHGVRGLVVDPVLVATSGDSLAGSEVAEAIKRRLFPLATVITPNVPEASAMLGGCLVRALALYPVAHIQSKSCSAWQLAEASVTYCVIGNRDSGKSRKA